MASNAQKLADERVKLVEEMRSLDEKHPDGMPADVQEQFDKLDERQEALGARIERSIKLEKLESELDETLDKAPNSNSGDGDETRTEEQKKKTADLHRKAFRAFLTGGKAALDTEEFRALAQGALGEGGVFVPDTQWVNDLVKAIDDAVVVRQLATVHKMTKAVSLGVPTLENDPDDADWTTELGTGSEDSTMSFGKRELVPSPFAKRIKLSNTLIRNSVYPVESLVQARLAYKFAITEEKGYLTGSGANQPLGLFTASANGIPTSRDVSTDNGTTAPTVNGLINALYSLKEGYQARATWLFHRDCVKAIRKLRSDSGAGAGTGDYLWQPAVVAGEPDTLIGRPVRKSEYVPNTMTTGQYVGIVGDFSYYWIADVLAYQIQRLVELYAESNQTGYIGRKEADGQPVLAEAFARVKLG